MSFLRAQDITAIGNGFLPQGFPFHRVVEALTVNRKVGDTHYGNNLGAMVVGVSLVLIFPARPLEATPEISEINAYCTHSLGSRSCVRKGIFPSRIGFRHRILGCRVFLGRHENCSVRLCT